MILIEFGMCLPSIKFQHEFGHKSYNKCLVLKLIFMTIILTKSNSKLTQFLYTYVNNEGVEGIPQYREQIKQIKSKARVQANKDYQNTINMLIKDRDRYRDDYIELKDKVTPLLNLAYQVRNIKSLSDEDLNNI